MKGVNVVKNKQHKLSQRKHELYNLKRKVGDTKPKQVMRLDKDEVEFVRQFCRVDNYMYEVRKAFRPGFNAKSAPGVLKRIYYAKKNPVYVVMDEKDVEICKNAGLKPIPYKFMVHLDTLK